MFGGVFKKQELYLVSCFLIDFLRVGSGHFAGEKLIQSVSHSDWLSSTGDIFLKVIWSSSPVFFPPVLSVSTG